MSNLVCFLLRYFLNFIGFVENIETSQNEEFNREDGLSFHTPSEQAKKSLSPDNSSQSVSVIESDEETNNQDLNTKTFPIWYHLVYPKTGNSDGDCEDKFEIKYDENQLELLAGISDGVSSASFAAEWASILVNNFINCDSSPITTKHFIEKWINQSKNRWEIFIHEQSLNWIAQRKLRKDRGSYATFLGLKISQNKEKSTLIWDTFAIGDCCLFIVEQEKIILSFPVDYSNDFKKNPDQINTSSDYNQYLKHSVKFKQGEQIKTDQTKIHFYLVTDALGEWIFKSLENEDNPWEKLNKFQKNSTNDFSLWIDKLRNSRQIRDDDTTLIHIIYG
jgi:hypothetical protein